MCSFLCSDENLRSMAMLSSHEENSSRICSQSEFKSSSITTLSGISSKHSSRASWRWWSVLENKSMRDASFIECKGSINFEMYKRNFDFLLEFSEIYCKFVKNRNAMNKKIFISHASEDEKVVSLFVDKILFAGSGVKESEVMYTSREDTGIANGEDIPETIKKGIKECEFFFMMVSDNYRRSEVCLNEMGAAWMCDNLRRKIIVLPEVGFDKIGWLMSLNKGTKLDNKDGLDMIHDEIVSVLKKNNITAAWNRNKDAFVAALKKNVIVPQDALVVSEESSDSDNEEEMDILDMREQFDTHINTYSELLKSFSKALTDYGGKLSVMISRLGRLQETPGGFSPSQVRGVLFNGAVDAERLACICEEQSPQLREHFELAMRFVVMLQGDGQVDEKIKKDNIEQCEELIKAMLNAEKEITGFRTALNSTPNIDKKYTSAINRLKKALDVFLEMMSFCIARTVEVKSA